MLDFILFCLHKGCGPSETSSPVDELKTQREAIRTAGLCGPQAGSELCGRTPGMAGACQRVGERKCLLLLCRDTDADIRTHPRDL